jgi:hypothetical protein
VEGTEDRTAERNFVLIQGFEDASPAESAARFDGLMWLGSNVFHLLTGSAGFANRTLPWSRPAAR